jgi:hypothetical protein
VRFPASSSSGRRIVLQHHDEKPEHGEEGDERRPHRGIDRAHVVWRFLLLRFVLALSLARVCAQCVYIMERERERVELFSSTF